MGRRFPNREVTIAWQSDQRLSSAFAKDSAKARRIAIAVLESFHTCPITEIARLGRTLRSQRQQFLAHFTTGIANNGGLSVSYRV